MNRFSAAVVAFSVFCLGSISVNAADDPSCPPGAKFCPVPGSSGGGAESGGGLRLDAGLLSASSSYSSGGDGPGMYSPSVNARAPQQFNAQPHTTQTFESQSFESQQFASAPQFQGAGSQSHFENQLNEGERLIMVAPSTPLDFMPDNSVGGAYSSGGMYPAMDSYPAGEVYSAGETYSSAPMYADGGAFYDDGSLSASTSTGYDDYGFAGTSSGAFDTNGFPAEATAFSNDFSSDGFADAGIGMNNAGAPSGGFVPTPPGGGSFGFSGAADSGFNNASMPPAVTASAPTRTLYEETGPDSGYQQPTGRNYRPKKNSGAGVSASINTDPEVYAEQAVRTMPKGYVREEIDSSGFDEFERTQPTGASSRSASMASSNHSRARAQSETPSREDMARVRDSRSRQDAMSEVANETSRKSSRGGSASYGGSMSMDSGYNPSNTPLESDRVPWWKGGMWRNRKARNADKAEAKARKERNSQKEKGKEPQKSKKGSSKYESSKRDNGRM